MIFTKAKGLYGTPDGLWLDCNNNIATTETADKTNTFKIFQTLAGQLMDLILSVSIESQLSVIHLYGQNAVC